MAPWRRATPTDPHLAGSGPFALRRCGSCGSAVTVGDAPERGRLYEDGTYAEPSRWLAPLIEPMRRLADRDRMRFVTRVPPGGSVLELGAGDGRFVARLAAAGYDARGIDPAASATALAARSGARVERVDAESAEVEAGSLDAVIAWHSLEHLDDPAATVRRAHRWLRPGGRFIVAVPELGSLQARLGGDVWFHQDVPRHRTHFTHLGLTRMLERCGMRVSRSSHLLVEQNPYGMWQTLLNRLTGERDFAYRLLKRDLGPGPWSSRARDFAITVVAGALMLPVAFVLEAAAGAAGRGGSMVVEAET